MRRALAALVGMLMSVRAEVPVIDAFFPAGCQAGSGCEVKAEGKMDPWPPKVWVDDPKLRFTPDEKEKGTFRVNADAALAPGPRLVRFYNAEGASPPRIFVVGGDREAVESEKTRTPGDFPIVINGKLDPAQDIDTYPIALRAGEGFEAVVTAYACDSPIDPLLHVRSPRGDQLAFNHDGTTIGLDPRLAFTAEEEGTYRLLLSGFVYPPRADVRFGGGNTTVYRLRLGHRARAIEHGAERDTIAVPGVVDGWIGAYGERDRYAFSAKKDQTLRFEVHAATLGSLADPALRILGAEGKALASGDDIDRKTQHDVALDWKAPSDGTYTAEIRDLNRNSGRDHHYQLAVSLPEPRIDATAGAHAFTVKAGGKAEIKIVAARKYGHKDKATARVEGLPEGVTAAHAEISEKGGEVTLTLEATSEVTAFGGPISILVNGAPVIHPLKGKHADAGDLLVNETTVLWLTVLKKS